MEQKKPDIRMSYKTLISLPDSYSKYLILSRKVLCLQVHGPAWEEGVKEVRRLDKIYKEEYLKRLQEYINKNGKKGTK